MKKSKAVVLLSGGLDSTVTLASAMERGFECFALTVNYGQRHKVELEAARRVATAMGAADHKIVELDLRTFGGSALTAEIDVPKNLPDPAAGGIPITYVPARNALFLTLALAWAEVLGANDIFIGVSAVDYSGYPDCRPEFIEQYEKMANLGTRAADGGTPFRIHAPLAKLSKADTVRLGERLAVDFGLTHSCYDPAPSGAPCGSCDSCLLRQKGFSEAGIVDPRRAGDVR